MVEALLRSARGCDAVAVFELVGAVLVVAAVWVLTWYAWGLLAAGVLALVKSFDLAVGR